MTVNHFTATGIVFNEKKEILMIKHNKLKVWLPPGGHVDENELPDEAALREIYEETGIRARFISAKQGLSISSEGCRELERPFAVLLEDIEGGGAHNHIDLIYLCTAEGGELRLQESEVEGIGWFSVGQIANLETYENVVLTVEKASAYLNEIS